MIDGHARANAVAAELLAAARLPDAAARAAADKARTPEYWRTVAPAMSIGGAPQVVPETSEGVSPPAIHPFEADGYFQLPLIIDSRRLSLINDALDAVIGHGWPPAFVWVYDELWSLARQPALSDLLTRVLGAGYAQIPHVWTHIVPSTVGASGWPPHFDFEFNDRGRMSVWVALTAATLSNGCMHLVPKTHIVPEFAGQDIATERVVLADALRALHSVRALPAAPGTALAWGADVLHWGGPCLKNESPRRAVSMEFIAPGVAPTAAELPLVGADAGLPPFADRVKAIAAAILAYRKFEPSLVRFAPIAERLRA